MIALAHAARSNHVPARLLRLAAAYEELAARPSRHPGALTARIPVNHMAVEVAQSELQDIATRLRSQPVPPREGVRAARDLLTDGAGPLFRSNGSQALRVAARDVLARLGGEG